MEEDICGLCGEPGADKFHHPVYWPTETVPNTELVHAECEHNETVRAFNEFKHKVGQKGVDAYLRSI